MRTAVRVVLLGALALLLSTGCRPASDAPVQVARLSYSLNPVCSADSLCYVLTWSPSTDAKGAATSYTTTVTQTPLTGGVLPSNKSTTTASTNFTVLKPSYGTEVTFTVSVAAVRRGLSSAPTTATWKYKRQDAPPPPPGPVTVDSSSIVAMEIWPSNVQLVSATDLCRSLPDSVQISDFGVVDPRCMGVDSTGVTIPMTVRFCASYKLLSGRWAMSANSVGFKPCEDHVAVLNQ